MLYCFGTAIDYILSKAVDKDFLSKTRSNNNKKITIMKTNLISKAVVMMVVVMASVMNFSASASNPTQYIKNEEMTGELRPQRLSSRTKTDVCSATSVTRILTITKTA